MEKTSETRYADHRQFMVETRAHGDDAINFVMAPRPETPAQAQEWVAEWQETISSLSRIIQDGEAYQRAAWERDELLSARDAYLQWGNLEGVEIIEARLSGAGWTW